MRVPARLIAAGRRRRRGRLTILSVLLLVAVCAGLARAEAGPDDLAGAIRIEPPGGPARSLDLAAAVRALNVPSVGVAVLADGRIAWSHGFGAERDAKPLYQAASMSKFVAAVVALRLVEAGVLSLDAPVDATLRSFKTARPPLTDGHPVILRRLLAMRAGIGVPGFLGYDPGAPLPTLAEILDGTPPAKSPAVRVVARPGSRYAYSGGVLMKRGQNIGFQGYLILFPETGQGMVVMTGSDNGTTLAEALIRRAAEVYGWPALGHLGD